MVISAIILPPGAASERPSPPGRLRSADSVGADTTGCGKSRTSAGAVRGPRRDAWRPLAVYAGGLAMALGGVFLVRYSIEAGLIGPRMRIFLGALLAAGLIALGDTSGAKNPSSISRICPTPISRAC